MLGDPVVPFHDEWRRIHNVYPFECWSDEGYNPDLSDVPRDIQIFAAMDYGTSDINNGGFHQFFHNSTGMFAPEMVEWCNRAGLEDVAEVIRDAMDKLVDGEYPRSRAKRVQTLRRLLPAKTRVGFEGPFDELNNKFYFLLSNNGSRYDDAANRWLRETCGISDLDDPPSCVPPEEFGVAES